MDVKVNIERLKKDVEDLGRIGRSSEGGVSRSSFSPSDLEARAWLKDRLKEAGLEVRQDGAGNIFGRLPGEGKTVMAGSHIDTVINGGLFDGSIGVLAAIECLRRIQEENIPRTRPLEAAAFTDEEGNLVGDFLGSRAFVGGLDRSRLEKGLTFFGHPLGEILKRTEFTIDGILGAHRDRPEMEAFIELHIEQGAVLETEEASIGIVERIAGKNDWYCSLTGRAGHAGTTPFELRQDAFLGLADFALKSTHHVATRHYGSLLTIGRVGVYPGSFSIIPDKVEFTLDFRSTSAKILAELEKSLTALAEDTAAARGLRFRSAVMDRTSPVIVPERITNLLHEECQDLGYRSLTLSSGAGHDAQILASVADTGMIFIPCEDGISHSPEENIGWEDLEKGANLLLRALVRLAG